MAKDKSEIYNIVLFGFKGEKKADEIVKDLHKSGTLKGYKILIQATVSQDKKGKSHFKELGRGGLGAGIGATGGGLLWLLGGPAGLLAFVVGGAVLGGVAGKYLGRPIKRGDMKKFAQALTPDTSALLLLVEDRESAKVIDTMTPFKAKVVTLALGDELSGELAIFTEGVISVKPEAIKSVSKTAKKVSKKTGKKAAKKK